MKKIFPIILFFAAIAVILSVFFFVLPSVNNKPSPDSTSQMDNVTESDQEEGLIPASSMNTDDITAGGGMFAEDGPDHPIDFNMVDFTGTFSRERLLSIKEQTIKDSTNFIDVALNITPDTPDYSDTLVGLLSPVASERVIEETRNIYKVFHGLNMNCKVIEVVPKAIHINKEDDYYTVNVFGYVTVEYESDRQEKARRNMTFQSFFLDYEDGFEHVLTRFSASYADDDAYHVYYEANTALKEVVHDGNDEFFFDFVDPEGFLTDYNYGEDFEEGEWKEYN